MIIASGRRRPDCPLVPGLVWRPRVPGRRTELAAGVGLGERQLRRRCEDAVGYGPKTLERVLRFQRFRSLASRGAASLAELALLAGYADQPHLTREYRRLAGGTPGGDRRWPE